MRWLTSLICSDVVSPTRNHRQAKERAAGPDRPDVIERIKGDGSIAINR